jgi:hypothetical protein
MTNSITINQLNEALSRQTVMILDRVDEMIDEKLDSKLKEFHSTITEDFGNQLTDMMTLIDKRFDTLEKILTGTVVRLDDDHESRIQTLEHYGKVNSTTSPI